jgi:spore maturation protein CgeB
MPRELRIAYFAHTVRSDWNNGNAHFLRGLLQNLGEAGQHVIIFEPQHGWSIDNLLQEPDGAASLAQFHTVYPQLHFALYDPSTIANESAWREQLRGFDIIVLHEWSPPALAHLLLALKPELGYKLLFHDTHHRASSSPEQIALFGIPQFDGVLAFGEALRSVYRDRFGFEKVWTFHEAADVNVFKPADAGKQQDVVWIGNWGEGERSGEIHRFLLDPAAALPHFDFVIYGVRYPQEGLDALQQAGVLYGGYLPNLQAPATYAASRLTVHLPRQQYSQAMHGIPTIRVFEAMACGIPLISAPWSDSEGLFRKGDFAWAGSTEQMTRTMQDLLTDSAAAAEQAARGRETVLARHTCAHRAQQFLQIAEELFR